MPVTSAFTSATSIIIASSQVKGLFGITVSSKGIVDMYVKFFQNVSDTKIPDLALGLFGIGFLLGIRVSFFLIIRSLDLDSLFLANLQNKSEKSDRCQSSMVIIHRKKRPLSFNMLNCGVLFPKIYW